MSIGIKRAYADAAPTDGYRVLVDRLWPRGVSKTRAELDLWAKDVAPSAELRRAWHADPHGTAPAGFDAFAAAYRQELARPPARDALDELVRIVREQERVTLVYGAKDPEVNHAVVLRDVLEERLTPRR